VAAPEDGPYDATADLPALDAGAPVTETLPPPPDPEPESPTTAATGAVRDSLPTAEQLMANGSLQGQTLNMDLHVYSTTPAERFVFINMRRHNEGAELPEGGRIEEITPEGVVIDRNGQRFLLTRD
jgi:general secretion pathway protein B